MEILPPLQDVLKEQSAVKPTMLHITNGESVAGTLRESAVPGDVRIYGDLMYEGPAPAGLDSKGWIEVRADFLSKCIDVAREEARGNLEAFEASLEACPEYDETVLWLDHRLSDQLILIKLLDRFSRFENGSALKCSLICPCRYPGMDRFVGLGQLTADQLTSLLDTRLQISDAQFRLASVAWNAFTEPNPTAIEAVIQQDTSPLPFLAAALRRHLEQFPSAGSGLSRSERQILSVLREHGSLPAIKLFFAVQQMEDPLFMGDLSLFGILKEMAFARHPLIHVEDPDQHGAEDSVRSIARSPVTITETGQRVLDGQLDHVKLNGTDRWLGGVHLNESGAAWRWDVDRSQLVISS